MLNRTICFSKGTACSRNTHAQTDREEKRERDSTLTMRITVLFQILEPKENTHTHTHTHRNDNNNNNSKKQRYEQFLVSCLFPSVEYTTHTERKYVCIDMYKKKKKKKTYKPGCETKTRNIDILHLRSSVLRLRMSMDVR